MITNFLNLKFEIFQLRNITGNTAIASVLLPLGSPFFICTKESGANDSFDAYYHQGVEKYKSVNIFNFVLFFRFVETFNKLLLLQISTYKTILPLWVSILVILTCLTFSALFSGLNLGLMALDRTELKILCNTGTEKVSFYKKKTNKRYNLSFLYDWIVHFF